jgi:glycosyltransferase involved in cell wall biosynthesis
VDSPTTFTVVMTVFRRPDLVPAALFSVASQEYPHWDLIVHADGPHPRVAAMVEDFRAGEPALAPRISYRTLPRAEGLWGNRARREGLERASGDYTTFLGHDCLLLPGYLAAHAGTVDKPPDRHDVTLPTPRYCGVWPMAAGKGLYTLGPRDGIDLTSLAFPTSEARRLGVFGPEMERCYGADYLSYVRCRGVMPVVHRPGVVAAHF